MRGSSGGGSWLPFRLDSVPVVRGILVAVVASFLVFFFARSAVLWMPFRADAWTRPWTWFTYAVLETDPIGVLFQGFWLYVVGGMLERAWGSRNFLAIFLAFTAIAALAFVPAYYLLGTPVQLAGLVLPLSALTVAWAALDPELEVLLWGVLPLKAKLIALLDVLLVYFFFGFAYGPVAALFTLAGPAAAFYYVRKMPRLDLSWSVPSVRRRARRPARETPPRERLPGGIPRSRREQEELARLRKLLGEDDEGDRMPRP